MTTIPLFALMLGLAGFFLTWTVTVIGAVWWLGDQFKQTRHMFYGAMKHRDQRLLRLEIWATRKDPEFPEMELPHIE